MSDIRTSTYPVLPLRDIVVFPHMIVPLFVGREKSVRALEEVMQDDRQILLSSQLDPTVDDPSPEGIYRTGVLANVLQLLKLPDGTVKVLVEGKSRVKITDFIDNPSYFEASVEPLSKRPAIRKRSMRCCAPLAKSLNATPRSRRTSPKRRWLLSPTRANRRGWRIWWPVILGLMWRRNRIFLKPW